MMQRRFRTGFSAVLRALLLLGLSVGVASCRRKAPPAPSRPNVLLIVIDTLRADRLGCYGYRRETSPAVDGLAREGVVFDQSFSYSDGTIHSHLALFSSQYVYSTEMRGEKGKMLAEVFAENGYRTYGLSANPALVPSQGFARGFDHFTNCPVSPALTRRAFNRENFSRQTEVRSAEQTTKAVLQALRRHHARRPGQPWFMFVNYLDPHDPYTERPPWSERFRESQSHISGDLRTGPSETLWAWVGRTLPTLSDDDVARLGELYDAEIRYTDGYVARILAYLDEVGWRNETIVVVTSDHGEVLGEHEMFTHMLACYEGELRVPLIISAPWFASRGIRVSDLVETVDVGPTLLDLCGIEPPPRFVGRRLLSTAGEPVPTERSITRHFHWALHAKERKALGFPQESSHDAVVFRTAGKKLYVYADRKPRLFDISAYPERVEVHDEKAIRELLDPALSVLERDRLSPDEESLDTELRRALRSLGYVN